MTDSLPVVPSEIIPDYKNSGPHAARHSQANSFTGMVNTVSAGSLRISLPPCAHTSCSGRRKLEDRYKYNAVSTMGGTNAIKGDKLYDERLNADIELSNDSNRGFNAWNRRRQEAIDGGEDPNS